jgi:methylenetetrahydrofolate reductase (NADPH)
VTSYPTTPSPDVSEPLTHLEAVLRSGTFAVTAEMESVDSADPQHVIEGGQMLSGSVDAVNIADGSGAHCHISPVAGAALLAQSGVEPVMHLQCRDRNRLALQSDLVGASAMGVHNVLLLSGDDVTVGDEPDAKRVFDFDSLHLIATARVLRDRGTFLSGRELRVAPRLFIGAASNPFAPPFDWRPQRLAKKVEAGAQFIQSQYCYDVTRLRSFLQQARDLGVLDHIYYLVGVGPLRSARAARRMAERLPGVYVPDDLIARLESVPANEQRGLGVTMCVEMIQELREIEGVAGVHIMAYGQEHLVPEIVERAGLLPRPPRAGVA